MYNTLEIGPAPYDEEPQQCNLPTTDYAKVRAECEIYRQQLLRIFGPPPLDCSLVVTFERDGDHGYYEVAVKWQDPNGAAAVNYAYDMEENAPQYWDSIALKALREKEIPYKEMYRA
jgi:hypothetical protein